MTRLASKVGGSEAPLQYDVVVVGAGLSGLQTGQKIQAAGHTCVVLEAVDRVGGKTLSVQSRPTGPGVNDVGAAWINDTNQSEMFKLLRRYGFEGIIQRATGKTLHELPDGSAIALPYGELPLDEEQSQTMLEMAARFTKDIHDADLENPTQGPHASRLDKITFRDYCKDMAHSPIADRLANQLSRGFLGVEADDVSALYMIHYTKGGTGFDNMVSDGKDGGQYLRCRQGMGSFATTMAAELTPGSLHLSTPVTSIVRLSSGVTSVRSSTGATFECKKVVVSIPTTLYPTITFDPPLSPTKRLLGESTTLGYYSKMIFVFDKPWWREAGLSGVLSSSQGPVLFTRDTSVEADQQWSITCFITGDPGRKWSKLSKFARREAAWTQFYRMFAVAVDAVAEPLNVIEMEWTKQQYFQGAPCPVMAPGVLTATESALRTPSGNIHFVGTETSTVWKGYMEGAIRSGQRGAEEVIAAINNDKAG